MHARNGYQLYYYNRRLERLHKATLMNIYTTEYEYIYILVSMNTAQYYIYIYICEYEYCVVIVGRTSLLLPWVWIVEARPMMDDGVRVFHSETELKLLKTDSVVAERNGCNGVAVSLMLSKREIGEGLSIRHQVPLTERHRVLSCRFSSIRTVYAAVSCFHARPSAGLTVKCQPRSPQPITDVSQPRACC